MKKSKVPLTKEGKVDGGKIYAKGRRYEYKIVKQERARGCSIVFRSAGSHSPIDVISIDTTNHIIKLIQCKSGVSLSERAKYKIWKDNIKLNGTFEVKFFVV